MGASLVVNSLSKHIGGHGNALGGTVTDTGLYDWSDYRNIAESYRKGKPTSWGLTQIKKKGLRDMGGTLRSEEHTSELQSLMRISYAVFCLKKKKQITTLLTT